MKERSDSLNNWKAREYLGDTLVKFVVNDLYFKKYPDFRTNTHIPKTDMLVKNYFMINIAKALGLTPHPEDLLEHIEFAVDKPYANAFEVHVYDMYLTEGMEAVYAFIEQYIFSPEILERVEKWYQQDVERERIKNEAKLARYLKDPSKHKYIQHLLPKTKTDEQNIQNRQKDDTAAGQQSEM